MAGQQLPNSCNVFLNHQEAVFRLKLFIKHTCLSGKYFAGKIFVTNQRRKQLLMISKNVNFPGIILRIVTFPGIFCEISGIRNVNKVAIRSTCQYSGSTGTPMIGSSSGSVSVNKAPQPPYSIGTTTVTYTVVVKRRNKGLTGLKGRHWTNCLG